MPRLLTPVKRKIIYLHKTNLKFMVVILNRVVRAVLYKHYRNKGD